MKKTFPEILSTEAGHLFAPLEKLDTKEDVTALVKELGWDIQGTLNLVTTDLDEIKKVPQEIAAMWQLIGQLIDASDNTTRLALAKDILAKAKFVIKTIKDAVKKIEPVLKQVQQMVEDGALLKRLLDYLFYKYFENRTPKFFAFLYLLGITNEEKPDDGSTDKKLKVVHWNYFEDLFTDPIELMNQTYKWETNFDGDEFLKRFEKVLKVMSIPGGIYKQSKHIRELLGRVDGAKEIRMPLYQEGVWEENWVEIDLNLSPVPANGQDKKGLFLYPYMMGTVDYNQAVGKNWEVEIVGDGEIGGGLGLEIRPPAKLLVNKDIFDEGQGGLNKFTELDFEVKFKRKKEEGDEDLILFGKTGPDATALSLHNLEVKLFAKNKEDKPDFGGELDIEKLKLQVRMNGENGDGFLKKVMPEGFDSEFDLTLGWTKARGLYFNGAAGLEISIPLDTSNSKLFDLKSIDIAVKASTEGGLKFHVAATGGVKLGPINAFIEKVGLKSDFSFPQINGNDVNANLGIMDVVSGFKLPSGIALEIDGEGISGGGYLSIEEHRYAGILALNLKAIELTAIGLITTRLPNNQPGFSMLISISVLFDPGIQLSFGFSLKGVGGLIGVNRTFKVEALRQRLASGSINSIMFPVEPLKNVDKIISDLREVFPPQEKHFVVAPFLRIGWSKFLEFDVGVLLEFPFKGRIILLGSVALYLPEKEKPLVELHIDVLGDFNFPEQYIRIEGILRDSYIKDIPLTGGFAFFLSWGNKPAFLFSAGGYHPRYKKPARFPSIPRVGAVITYGENVNLTCEFYTAVTSNSFQTGFRADLLAKFKGAEIKGYFSFDALIYFRPFSFITEIAMGVSVKYKKKELAGVDLYFMLSGPKPWNVVGRAKVKIAFIKFKVDFSYSWGGDQQVEQAPTIGSSYVLGALTAELSEDANWTAQLPTNFSSPEILRPLKESEQGLILHPSGYLEVRQNVVPFNRSIKKYAGSYVTGRPKFAITAIKLGEHSENAYNLKEHFSRSQFEDLSDEEKISSPDFELMNAGLRFDNTVDYDIPTEIESVASEVYENVVLDESAFGLAIGGRGLGRKPGKKPVLGQSGSSGKVILGPGKPIGQIKDRWKIEALERGDKVVNWGGHVVVIPLPGKSNKKLRNWESERFLRNRSQRQKRFQEKPEQAYQLPEEELIFKESQTYSVLLQEQLGFEGKQVRDFSSFSEAKDFLENLGKQEAPQVIIGNAMQLGNKKKNP